MNATDAVVVRVDAAHAWVRTQGRQKTCGACARKDDCAVAGTGRLLDGDAGGQLLCLPNTIHARPGDRVSVQAADGEVWRAVWQAYGIPLLFALGAAIIGKFLSGSDLLAGGAMLLGLLSGYLLLRHSARAGLDLGRKTPTLTLKFKSTP